MRPKKRSTNPYRRAIHDIIRDESIARPSCALAHSLGIDEDGYYYVHFTCLSHDSSWRYYVHVYVDTELIPPSDHRSQLWSRCPASRQERLAGREVVEEEVAAEEDSSAQAELESLIQSEEEHDDLPA